MPAPPANRRTPGAAEIWCDLRHLAARGVAERVVAVLARRMLTRLWAPAFPPDLCGPVRLMPAPPANRRTPGAAEIWCGLPCLEVLVVADRVVAVLALLVVGHSPLLSGLLPRAVGGGLHAAHGGVSSHIVRVG